MKIGLITSSPLWKAPFLKYYTDILDRDNIEYSIISWNRDGRDSKSPNSFNKELTLQANKWQRLYSYILFGIFAKGKIKQNKYDKLIVFGSQLAIVLYPFLKMNFKKKFILDYRDQSIEQKFKKTYLKVLNISSLNVISSPGFKRFLPNNHEYILCHNFDRFAIDNNKPIELKIDDEKIKVLTIGAVRDYQSNIELIDALNNNNSFELEYIGESHISNSLTEYVSERAIWNVTFKGYYEKEIEKRLVLSSTIMNAFHSKENCNNKNEVILLSNRLYLSVLCRRPLIVTAGTVQGEYVKKHNVGIVVDNCNNLDTKILKFLNNLNVEEYNNNCDVLLQLFIKEQIYFEKRVLEFINTHSN